MTEVSVPEDNSSFESLTIDDEGFLILKWPTAVTITGPAARQAMNEVNRICGGTERPMLVDMATTKSVSREARVVFGEKCAASRIAMLGRSQVDRVIANFALGRIPPRPPCPTKFFTDRDQAFAFLREGLDERVL
ncbi:MAG: STAS/SEC14 domain-containing protein [Nakamurella sp.]